MRAAVDGLFNRDRYARTTGDPELDRKLDQAMQIVARLFGVKPAFGFYDPKKLLDQDDPDGWVMNAWATSENTAVPGTSGTVAFGNDLFRKELYEYDRSGSTVMAIIAHEFAHILQANRGYLDRMRTGSPLKSEINADFLAGYFLGTRKLEYPSMSFQKAADLFIRLGKSADGNPRRTHGNSTERMDAAEAGFGVAYREKRSFEEAVVAGLNYVQLSS